MRFSAPPPKPRSTGRPGARRALFIDKDGTLVENVPYNVDLSRVRFTPHAVAALRKFAAAGFVLIVVSNQPGLAERRFPPEAFERLSGGITALLAEEGVALAGVYACPHAPPSAPSAHSAGAACRCRKPAPGLLLEAARDHGIDLARSWMVGDILDDVEAGRRAGCGAVLLDVGNETEWVWSPMRVPQHRVPHLLAAADAIVAAPVPARSVAVSRRPPTIRRPAHRKARERWAA